MFFKPLNGPRLRGGDGFFWEVDFEIGSRNISYLALVISLFLFALLTPTGDKECTALTASEIGV
jgi:hypothetical protein